MFNTLYNFVVGIALAIGAMGASDDFDGAQLAQNAFFGAEDELEAIDEQEMTTENVQGAKDIDEWNEIAAEVMSMSLQAQDELTDDEKLEIAVLTEDIPADNSENLEEVPQIAENTQSEGLSEEEFYSMLEHQFSEAMKDLESVQIAQDDANLPKEEVNPDDNLDPVVLPPEEDVYADLPSDQDSEQVAQVKEISEESFTDKNILKTTPVGLPDISDEDMVILTNQVENKEESIKTEQNDADLENVQVQDIPVLSDTDITIPDVEAPELDLFDPPLFDETEDSADVEETEEVEENADVEETEEVEENANVEETEEVEENADVEETEEVEENADVEETEEVKENADVEETEEVELTEDVIVEPLEDDANDIESKDDALLIPSLEIPPAVISEQERARISAEVDAIVEQDANFDSWIPRQIPVTGSVDESAPETKPEDDFIQEFSRKNVKESILENTGIDIK